MWELRIASPFGRLSTRKMLAFVAAIFATAFAFVLLSAPTAHAADVTWNGDSVMYGGKQYQKAPSSAKGLPGGDTYIHIEPKDDSGGANAPDQKAHVISFPDGASNATSAQYAVYTFTSPDTFKNPSGQKNITADKKGNSSEASSCTVDGIGWIVCPVTTFMASSVDWLYSNVLTKFLEVRPAESNQDNALFKAWAIMRNLANVAFVIGFLVIIYSQVTSIGMSNYGIKRLLPRLVVAAVLVNISYWICALAIDISNILGYSLNDLMMGITESIRNGGSNTSITWEDATLTILSGGALGVAGILAVGSISGAIAMLLPLLVGVLIAAIVAVIVMAARQALIVILVIVSPLAFVAYLLPNTEKYFDKWKDMLMTMLLLFPIFSVIFGGSQLAGTAIIQNADSLVMLLLGMAVQVVPLVIMPFLMKFSGSLISRIGGMANDKTKGLVDRTRGFSNSVAESKKKKNLARENPSRWRNPLSRSLQAIDNGRRAREGRDKANDALADARWENSRASEKVDQAVARAEMIKNAATSRSDAHIDELKKTDPEMRRLNRDAQAAASRAEMMKDIATSDAEGYAEGLKQSNLALQQLDVDARKAKLDVDVTKAKVEANWEQLRAGNASDMIVPDNLSLSALANFAHDRNNLARGVEHAALEKEATDLRQAAAKRQQIKVTSDALLHNNTTVDGKDILGYAGGIQGKTGEEAALSKAVTGLRSQWEENIKNNQQLMKHFNVTMEDKGKLALGDNVPVSRPDGSTFTFSGDNFHAREAAIDEVLTNGPYSVAKKIIMESGVVKDENTGEVIYKGKTHDYQDTISRLVAGKVDKKASYWGSAIIDKIARGEVSGEKGLNEAITYHVENGKLNSDALAAMDPKAIEDLFNIATNPQLAVGVTNQAKFDNNILRVRETVKHITTNDLLSRGAKDQTLQHMNEFLKQTENWQQPGS